MAVEELFNSSTITVDDNLVNIVDVNKTGLYEGCLFFNNMVDGDSFDVYLEVYNKFRAELQLYRFREITYANLNSGLEKAVHFSPMFTSHYRIKIQQSETGLNARDVDYYFQRYF